MPKSTFIYKPLSDQKVEIIGVKVRKFPGEPESFYEKVFEFHTWLAGQSSRFDSFNDMMSAIKGVPNYSEANKPASHSIGINPNSPYTHDSTKKYTIFCVLQSILSRTGLYNVPEIYPTVTIITLENGNNN